MKNKKNTWYIFFALITFIGTVSMMDARRGGGWGRGGWSGRRGGYGWNRGWSGRRGFGWGRPYVGFGLGSYYSPYYYSPYYYGSPGVGFAIGF